jgi:hypothetical protein
VQLIMTRFNKIIAISQRLRRDTSGLALVEFAYSLPLLLGLGGYGIELANLANTNVKISLAATSLADNMSRVGLESVLSTVQIRESDVNDSFIGYIKETEGLDATVNGRVILSSLERNPDGGNWIHWQRCIGTKNVNSSYGVQDDGKTGTSFTGMGPAGARVTAPDATTAVMVVEVIYDYKSLFGNVYFPQRTIKYLASFVVRDDRDLRQIYNPTPAATAYTCNRRTAT